MTTTFARGLVEQLRPLPDHRLTAIVEMARLSPPERQQVFDTFGNAGYPILHQQDFANLRDIGPWLFCSGEHTSLQRQFDFHHDLSKAAGDAPTSWLISALEPSRLAFHLGEAAIARGPDGRTHLLRFYSEKAFPVLHSRQDLPGIVHLLAPIHSWWLREPESDLDDGEKGWRRYAGKDRADYCGVPPIHLDQLCWDDLTGDALSYRLVDLIDKLQVTPATGGYHGKRLAQVRKLLAEARRMGFRQQADQSDYALLMALHDRALRGGLPLQAALKDALEGKQPLAQALKRHITPKMLTSPHHV